MKFRTLGRSDLSVSDLCLGTMTWGSQNTQGEAFAQLDLAVGAGINFIDTAEMYPTTPGTPENVGSTETILGNWLAASGKRDQLVIATKATGPGAARVRGGEPLSGDALRRAIEGSLRRLQTDYIDLYQLHWANRGSYHMRQNWTYAPQKQSKGEMDAHVQDILHTLSDLHKEGKIREWGLSNETVWGTLQFIFMAEAEGLPRPVSMQNEYSLLCRHFDLDFAETCHHEDISLLAWSPLAAGLLSGKYMTGNIPAGSRRSMQDSLNGRATAASEAAVAEYAAFAERRGLALPAMAIAFCRAQPFTGSVIIGATDLDQLKTNLTAAALDLDSDTQAGIQEIRRKYPVPM